MKREDFLEQMHYKNYNGKSKYTDLNILPSHFSVNITEDIKESIEALTNKINFFNKDIITSNITELEVNKLLQEKNGIIINQRGEELLAINYNSIYDYFIETNKISSYEIAKIYRMEGENNEGILNYLSNKGMSLSDNIEWDSKEQPGPIEDLWLKSLFGKPSGVNFEEEQKQWFFACKNKDDLKIWFDDELCKEILKKAPEEAKIVEYVVPAHDTINTPSQTVFKFKNARKISEISLKEVIEKQNIENILAKKNKKPNKKSFKNN